jgi:hypothetical protein
MPLLSQDIALLCCFEACNEFLFPVVFELKHVALIVIDILVLP